MENVSKKKEELKSLEQIVKHNHIGSYGNHMLFRRLVEKYPCEYKDFVDKHYIDRMECMSSNIRRAYHRSIEAINVLYTKLLLHICDPVSNDLPEKDVIEKLEPLLRNQNKHN